MYVCVSAGKKCFEENFVYLLNELSHEWSNKDVHSEPRYLSIIYQFCKNTSQKASF